MFTCARRMVGSPAKVENLWLTYSADSISRRPIWSSTEATVALSSRIPAVATWANHCDEFHPVCKLDGLEKPTLPTRVLDIHPSNPKGTIKLITTNGSGGLDWPFISPKTYKFDGGKVAYFRMETKGSYSEKHNTVFDSPLGQRAWVLQEMVLSRRIVHFAEDQIYWSCDTMHASEDNLVTSVDSKRSDAFFGGKDIGQPYPTLKHSRSNPMDRNTRENGFQEWRDIVANYSRRQLTKPSDKPTALAGIIEVIQPCVDDTPFLGLWMSDLHRGLFWQKRGVSSSAPSESAELNFPSWSWLSSRDPVSYDYFTKKSDPSKLNYTLRVDCTSVRWSGCPHVSRILDAELVVTSRLIRVSVVSRHGLYVIPREGTNWPWNETSPAVMDKVIGLYQQIEVWALEVFEFRADHARYGTSYRQAYGVLLLEAVGKEVGVYKRVGTGVLFCEGGGKQEVYDLFDGVEAVTISLV